MTEKRDVVAKGYVVRKGNRYYAVIYEGTDPLSGRERRRWHPAGTSLEDAQELTMGLAALAAGVERQPGPTLAPSCSDSRYPPNR
jgi:hypothetical protein